MLDERVLSLTLIVDIDLIIWELYSGNTGSGIQDDEALIQISFIPIIPLACRVDGLMQHISGAEIVNSNLGDMRPPVQVPIS